MKQYVGNYLTVPFLLLFLFVAIGSTYDTFDDFNPATGISAIDLDDNVGHPGDGLGLMIPQMPLDYNRPVQCEVQTFQSETTVVTDFLPLFDNISRGPPAWLS